VDGSSFTINFTKGNGASRIVVIKEGSAVTGVPVNGVEYTYNSNFATAGTEFTAGGEYVVYKGTGTSFTVSKLNPSTTYYISIFEYNGSGATTQYLMLALTGSQATVSAPTIQASALNFTNVVGNSVTLNFTKGNGAKRLVLARKSAAVNAIPVDLKAYSYSPEFGDGNVINTDNYVVYASTGSQVIVTGLEPATAYHFSVFEYNGNSAPMYLRPGIVANITTNAGPTEASKSISFGDIEGNGVTMTFATGNGSNQLIIARKGAAVTAVPVNGVTYTANTVFGQGTEIAPGQFVLNTTLDSRTFTGMDPASVYHFRIYDYDVNAAGQTYYLTSAYVEKSQSTAVAPTTQASAILFQNVTGSSATLKFTQGNGSYRLSVIKEGSPVDAIPVDLIKYNTNGSYGLGAQITPGNYALSNANGNTVNIVNLTPGRTYHIAVFEFNGQDFPVYLKPAATASISLPAEPTQSSTSFFINSVEGNLFRANWTNGNGSRRVVIAKKGSAVTARPADGTTYTANANFGQGQQVATGEFVVYDGSFNNVGVENLEVGSTYHFAVFEYNASATGPDYLTSTFLAGNGATLSAPTTQTTSLAAGSIQATQATISFTKGNGVGRIFFMRENSPVSIQPQDLVSYNYHNIFGTAGTDAGSGNYVVNKTLGVTAFTVTNLTPSTVYHVAAFEYNGSTGIVYLRPAGTYSFTTAVGSGVIAPTIAASNALFIADGNKLNVNWTNGNGSNRMVVVKQGSAVTFSPVNGTVYAANAAFGNGTDLGSGQYVVHNGILGQTVITNLQPGTTYHIAVFEYNGSGSNTRYLTSTYLNAAASTSAVPVTGSSNVNTLAGNQTISLNWTTGSGSGRLVVMKDGNAPSATPATLSVYPASSAFGNGAQLAAGEYVVYAGTNNNVLVTGLTPNKTYHFRIFEYNGNEAPVYNTANALGGNATTTAALPVKWVYFTARQNNKEVELEWATTNEQNAAYYIVERSANNIQFSAIDSLAARGNAGTNVYRVTDKTKPAGAAYYRIRQADVNHRYEYSKIVRVEGESKNGFSIYPNLIQDACRVTLPNGIRQTNIQIYNMNGTRVKTVRVQDGQFISLSNLPSGTYSVVMQEGAERFGVKVVKK
ncbi:MAG: T9SS type A sorting domain-containing protein, partial [Chitinophagaceae bacterium]